jgi:hypothetical protein
MEFDVIVPVGLTLLGGLVGLTIYVLAISPSHKLPRKVAPEPPKKKPEPPKEGVRLTYGGI